MTENPGEVFPIEIVQERARSVQFSFSSMSPGVGLLAGCLLLLSCKLALVTFRLSQPRKDDEHAYLFVGVGYSVA